VREYVNGDRFPLENSESGSTSTQRPSRKQQYHKTKVFSLLLRVQVQNHGQSVRMPVTRTKTIAPAVTCRTGVMLCLKILALRFRQKKIIVGPIHTKAG
jgi:hypothetical protein